MLLYDGQGSFTKKRLAPEGSLKIYLSEFLQKKKMEIIENSHHTYTSKLRLFYLYLKEEGIDGKPVACCTTEILSNFLHKLVQKKQLSSVTINKYKQLLHSFFCFLKAKKIISENPVSAIAGNIGVTKDEAPAA
ncbi:MAG: site-specific integrase, partial [Tannerella sp.]|nr:site-specific integrase [Tannerella sp.]